MKTNLSVVLLLGAMSALAAGCGASASSQPTPTVLPVVVNLSGITAEGRLEPVRFASIAPTADGLVSEVLVREGDKVEAGQVIARLDGSAAYSLESAQASAAVELGAAYQAVRTAQSRLDAYLLPRIFVGLTAEQAAQNWLQELDAANAAFEPYRDTSRKALRFNRWLPHLPRRVWFDTHEYEGMAKEYRKRVDVAWVNYRKAVAWLTLESDLSAAKARLAVAQTNSDALGDAKLAATTAGARAALANAEIRAPFAGTITNLDLKVGQSVTAGKAVVTIGDYSGWALKTTDLTEIDVVKIVVGQPVTVSLDAVPGASYTGTVQSIAPKYSERQGDVVFTVTILLNDRDPAMRWGMTAQVSFGE